MVLETNLKKPAVQAGNPGTPRKVLWFQQWAWLPVPAFILAICTLDFLNIDSVWNPPLLIPSLNLIFGAGITFFVAALAAKSYMAVRSPTILLLGCAMFAAGLGTAAGTLYFVGHNMSSNIAIISTMFCLSVFGSLASAVSGLSPGRIHLRSRSLLLASYLVILAIFSAVVILIQFQLWPLIYSEGSGYTDFGKMLSWITVGVITVAAALLMKRFVSEEANFRRWYGLGLMLFAVGYFGISLQTSAGDLVSWASRSSEYLGTVYILAAVISSIRQSGEWLLPLERALREIEEKYRNLFNNMTEGCALHEIICDDKGVPVDYRFLDINPAFERLTGLKRTDVVGRAVSAVLPGEDPVWVKKFGEVALTGKPAHFENYSLVLKRHYEVYAYQPAPRQFAIIFMDITERKRAEDALRRSETELKEAQRLAHIGSWTWDKAADTWTASDEIFRLWGLDPGQPFPAFRDQEGLIYPSESWQRLNPAFQRAAETGEGYEMDVKARRADDGTPIWFTTRSEAVRDASGKIVGLRGTIQDITERKRTEEALKEAKAQAELYLDLMGHDINNMHQIALGYLELAHGTLPVSSENEFLDKTIEVLQRSAQLIKNVRKLRKLKEGVFRSQEVDVCEILVGVQREFGAVPHKAITLNLNGRAHCYVLANDLLHDVFANLVSNAIKHTGDYADIAIHMDVVEGKGACYCQVSVEDNGPGISDDFKGFIFNRMLKGETKAKGIGLGLFLVKSLVESYNGNVRVEDRLPGDHTKGVRFVVMLPAMNHNLFSHERKM